MELKNLLSELRNRFGFQNLNPDENGIYRLLVNKKFTLNLTESIDRTALFLYSDIVSLNPDPATKLLIYERTLSANLFGKETNDAFFAFDPKRNVILLTKRLDSRLTDFPLFFEEFRDFINSLAYWDQIVSEGLLQSPKALKDKPENFIDTRKIV
jgi:hypothetical protein